MEHFASTGILMQMLKDDKYKRLVMENNESTLNTKEDFEALFEDYKVNTSDPDNYEYFTRRRVKKTDE